MPSRRRKRASPVPEPDIPAEDPASASDHDHRDDANDDNESSHFNLRFFNTTFSTYRASPFYVNPNLGDDASRGKSQRKQASSSSSILSTPIALDTLSKRLRDTLVGDVVRGVQVGLGGAESDAAALGRTGALLRVDWRWRNLVSLLEYTAPRRAREGSEELGGDDNDDDYDDDRRVSKKSRALCLSLEYENATFGAFLLPDLEGSDDNEEREEGAKPSWTWQPTPTITTTTDDSRSSSSSFIHLPLLLLRMPAALKSVLVDFLSSTFDCRISPLHLGTRTLVRSWEIWLSGTNNRAPTKDAALTLGFYIPDEQQLQQQQQSPPADDAEDTAMEKTGSGGGNSSGQQELRLGLKSIDVIVPAEQVQRFARAGRSIVSNNPSHRKRGPTPADDDDDEDKERQRRRKLAGGREEEGWAWRRQRQRDPKEKKKQSGEKGGEEEEDRDEDDQDQPFAEALAAYLDAHLALDLFHPGVRVLRVACDAFALSSGGRVKVFASSSSTSGANTWTFVKDLVACAQGSRNKTRWKIGMEKGGV
ncbi:kinetochore complex Sim4 subunit Fta1-domain-containing protein [Camillea tinctor]|nr:kinetochore complex Sim4 subunit Fta1-domain-containing protein [Camillea tinctor]